jgi:hemerythrin
MALIQWTDALSVNVKKFDDQHKMLVQYINELHDAMRAGQGKEAMGKILKNLVDYTKTHFAEEENLMNLHKYAGYAAQKMQHEKLVNEVLRIQKDFTSGTTVLSMDVMNFLKSWLTDHIQKTDKGYSSFFVSKGVK